MNSRSKASQSWLNMKMAFTQKRFASLSVVILIVMLIADVLPVSAVSTPFNPNPESALQAISTLTFSPEADAFVDESSPNTNTGTVSYLDVTKSNKNSLESYLRFTVSGTSGTIQRALLRVYCTTD